MAATNETFDGGTFIIYVDGVAVAYSTDSSLSITHTPRDIKSKTNGRWTNRAQGTYDVSGSCNVLYALLGSGGSSIYNLQDVLSDMLNGTSVTLTYTNDNIGDYEYTGDAQFSGINLNFGPHGQTVTGDFSFVNDGSWSLSEITS